MPTLEERVERLQDFKNWVGVHFEENARTAERVRLMDKAEIKALERRIKTLEDTLAAK